MIYRCAFCFCIPIVCKVIDLSLDVKTFQSLSCDKLSKVWQQPVMDLNDINYLVFIFLLISMQGSDGN